MRTMNLTHSISADRRTLTILADDEARAELRSWPESQKEADETGGGFGPVLHSDAAMFDAFECLICNSELGWILPEVCGDLTDAPILGTLGEEIEITPPGNGRGLFVTGYSYGKTFARPVLERWGFMSYALRSPLQDLRDTGRAVFVTP